MNTIVFEDCEGEATMITIGDRLRKFRRMRALTQLEVSKRAGINPSLYSQYENGDRRPKLAQLQRISEALDVDIALLQPRKYDSLSDFKALIFDQIENFGSIVFLIDDGMPKIGLNKIDNPDALNELHKISEAYNSMSISDFTRWLVDYKSDDFPLVSTKAPEEDLWIKFGDKELFINIVAGTTEGTVIMNSATFDKLRGGSPEDLIKRVFGSSIDESHGRIMVEDNRRNKKGSIGNITTENIGNADHRTKILQLMKLNPMISAREIAAEIKIAQRNVEVYISSLKKEGLLERVGKTKGGFWLVKEQS